MEENKYVPFHDATPNWLVLKNKTSSLCGELEVRLGPISNRTDNKSPEDIYKHATGYALDANKSATRSLALINNMNEISSGTYRALKQQEDQIDNMRSNAETLHTNITLSNRKLRGIESGFGSLANKITRTKGPSKQKQKKDNKLQQKHIKDRKQLNQQVIINTTATPSTPVSLNRDAGHYETFFHQTVKSTDTIIDKLSTGLDVAKDIALQLNVQLKIDSEKLIDLQENVNKEVGRVDTATRRSRALINH